MEKYMSESSEKSSSWKGKWVNRPHIEIFKWGHNYLFRLMGHIKMCQKKQLYGLSVDHWIFNNSALLLLYFSMKYNIVASLWCQYLSHSQRTLIYGLRFWMMEKYLIHSLAVCLIFFSLNLPISLIAQTKFINVRINKVSIFLKSLVFAGIMF